MIFLGKEYSSPIIIAEIGNNHQGSYDAAVDLIDAAIIAGADVVKFQLRDMSAIYSEDSHSENELGSEYIFDLLSKYNLSFDDHKRIFEYCERRGVPYLCTPWDVGSTDYLDELGVQGFKVASADFENSILVEHIISKGKDVIFSTGLSNHEVIQSLGRQRELLRSESQNFAYLHCVSCYPAKPDEVHLDRMLELNNLSRWIGYSGHERGISISIAAVVLGANIIERHLTLDKNLEGPDHQTSLLPDEFCQLVTGINEVYQALGDGTKKTLNQGEKLNRVNLGKSFYARKTLNSGSYLTPEDFDVRSPQTGLSISEALNLFNRPIENQIYKGDVLVKSHFRTSPDRRVRSREYFANDWGIPVRFHDWEVQTKFLHAPVLEFHLSAADMRMELFSKKLELPEFVSEISFHLPELFKDSHLLDLASTDKIYRDNSISFVVESLAMFDRFRSNHPDVKINKVVGNLGGWSIERPLNSSEIKVKHDLMIEALLGIDMRGFDMLIQSMAPFPWHFGGQRYSNIGMAASDLLDISSQANIGVCFDTSHSQLFCNHSGNNLLEMIKVLGPCIKHFHIGDASGVTGEGVPFGEGNVDFEELARMIVNDYADTTWVSEVWQGHLEEGLGCYEGMTFLKSKGF